MAKRPLDIMFVAAGLPPEELSRAGFPPAYVRGAFAPACRSRHAGAPRLYQPAMISTYFMAVGDRPVRSAARRDAVPSGKRRDAAGRSPTATFGRDKFSTGCVAIRLWCSAPRREPLLPGGEFLPGEIGRYHCRLV